MKRRTYSITLLSDRNSWINAHLPALMGALRANGHRVRWVHTPDRVRRGDIVFLLGCGQIVDRHVRARNKHNLVVHESALPHGRGWSPMTWQILERKRRIPIALFEAADTVDSGKVYLRDIIRLTGNELVDEWRQEQAAATFRLCKEFVRRYPAIAKAGSLQRGRGSYYRKRTWRDSRLDPNRTLREQFDLLRVVDNMRYPAFFEKGGETFIVRIEKKSPRRSA